MNKGRRSEVKNRRSNVEPARPIPIPISCIPVVKSIHYPSVPFYTISERNNSREHRTRLEEYKQQNDKRDGKDEVKSTSYTRMHVAVPDISFLLKVSDNCTIKRVLISIFGVGCALHHT